jgi:single-stranded-DNA-specific exonuclease
VALGTVADVVPLIGLNRAYVRAGLRRLDRIPGIKALLAVTTAQARQDAEAAGRKWRDQPVSARTCGFSLGPCINAAGRIADTRTGTRLLISDDDADVLAIASQLEQLNRERRAIEKQMVEECVSRVEAAGEPGRVIVMFDTAWHPGVVGIAASRVRDRFDRSAVIIGQDGKGSGRSVDGFNIGKAFLRAMKAGLLVKGGGHAAAGGLTIDPAKVPEFVAFMQLAARDFEVPATRIDLVRPVGGLKVRSIEEFRCLEPIGKDNEQPRVVFTGGILRRVQDRSKGYLSARLVGGDYTVEVFVRAEGTRIGAAIRAAEGHYVDMLGEVSLNSYGGKTSVQIKPSDIMVGAVADSYARAA